MSLELSSLRLYQESDQVVTGFGQIVADHHYWVVDYTISREGYVDRDYSQKFVERDHAYECVRTLMGRGND